MAEQSHAGSQVQSFVFNSLMDSMHANLYITDLDTDEIIFMSRSMRQLFGLAQPEGKICWQVLQKGMTGRCPFCPISQLLKLGDEDVSVVWEEKNTINGRCYENYDSLIRWNDGRLVHLQHSVDVTEVRQLTVAARMDELTGLLNRRAGKKLLERALLLGQETGEPVTICLFDLNELKQINDHYGHEEGDRCLAYVSAITKECLRPKDNAFRLSGDEFVIICLNSRLAETEEHMRLILSRLREKRGERGIPYDLSFCYGLAEALPRQKVSMSDLLAAADEQMYQQKRLYHIRKAEKKLKARPEEIQRAIDSFDYNREHLYTALIESTDDYIYIGNMKTGVFRYAPAMVREFDLPGEIIPNAAAVWGSRIHPHDKLAFLEANQEIADGRAESHNVEYRAKNRYDQWVWLRCRGHLIRDKEGNPDLFAGIITNLGHKNKIDPATGLFNKFGLEEEIRRNILDYPASTFGLMLLGLDDFKHINDLYDRLFGDEVIRLSAQKILSLLPANASIFRMDGDEYAVLIKNIDEGDFERIYRQIQTLFPRQQEYNGKKYFCSISAGCALYPVDADNYPDLLKFANYSLEFSKLHGKNRYTVFSSDILSHKERALRLTELLRESVEKDFQGFSLCYQPQVETLTGRVVGAEALCRWRCEEYGEISPVEFIPLLEQSNLIIRAGKWIFYTAARQCAEWLKLSPGFVMSINLSYFQPLDEGFLRFVDRVSEETSLPPANLMVELTETHLVKEDKIIRRVFLELQSRGIAIAMDDFGTGYSSLGLLKNTPVDLIKIDRVFVKDIQENTFDAAFIRSIVALCHDVGKQVCLEGVETEGEYKVARDSGMEYIQGYYFGRPLPAEDFARKHLSNNG